MLTVKDLLANTGHDPHVDGNEGGVGDLNSDLGEGRADGSHGEGDHIHGPALHGTIKEVANPLPHLGGGHPVVGWASILLLLRANEGGSLRSDF